MSLALRARSKEEMKSKAGFLSLAEELQSYILILLPYRDILRCSSVCKALRHTYLSYSELQYIVELGGQQLLRAPNTDPDNHISISQRLQLLRNRAHAWFRLDVHTCTTISIPDKFRHSGTSSVRVANGHLCLWDNSEDSATVLPILPDASQQTIQRDWSPRSLRSDPDAHTFGMFMDPAQNLVAVAYAITDDHLQSGDEKFYIDLEALDGGGIHPQAAGHTLFLSELPGYEDPTVETDPDNMKLKGFGRHIAFWRTLHMNDANLDIFDLWELQIWDWQHSTTSSCVLTYDINPDYDNAGDFCFLGNDRLLVFNDNLKLYSIEDMTQAPQLLACFLLPISSMSIGFAECILPMDDNLQLPMQAQQLMWTSDPQHLLFILSLETFCSTLVFIISTAMFFNPDFSEGMAAEIPWNDWGPSNSRAFLNHRQCRVGVSGNRVLQACPVDGTTDEHGPSHSMEYRLHAMDFSPLAIERRQGVGRVVKEPSTIIVPDLLPQVSLTTNLPYVEVALDRIFSYPFDGIWIDKDTIYLCHGYDSELEVIEITPRVAC